ncbi:MAG: TolB family protein, partial [Terriglobales bacterium]
SDLVWLDQAGKPTGTLSVKFSGLLGFRLSPDGGRVAVVLDAGVADIWVIDLRRGTRTRLTSGPVGNASPVWSPDGQWIAYGSLRDGHDNIYRRRSDGSGSEELLLADGNDNFPSSWSPDGHFLLFTGRTLGPQGQSWQLPLDGDRRPTPLLPGHEWAYGPKFSPDGHWITYQGSESGQQEVYLIPFPVRPGRWQVSVGGGMDARWERSGKAIVVIDRAGNLYSVPATLGHDTPQFGPPQRLFSFEYDLKRPRLELAPDGRFLAAVSQGGATSLTLMHPWMAALKK